MAALEREADEGAVRSPLTREPARDVDASHAVAARRPRPGPNSRRCRRGAGRRPAAARRRSSTRRRGPPVAISSGARTPGGRAAVRALGGCGPRGFAWCGGWARVIGGLARLGAVLAGPERTVLRRAAEIRNVKPLAARMKVAGAERRGGCRQPRSDREADAEAGSERAVAVERCSSVTQSRSAALNAGRNKRCRRRRGARSRP